MKTKIIFVVSGIGILIGIYSAYVFSQRPKAQPPAFKPTTNPYERGIFANGIIESAQSHGSNINMYPEVSGAITKILVSEGDAVKQGDPLIQIDDSVQRAVAQQQHAQAEASRALLEQLKAEPRPESLDVAKAQIENAKATLKNAQDQLTKQEEAHRAAPGAVSLDTLDNARNAERVAETNLTVVQRQYDLIKAGAWVYEIKNQERQCEALEKAAAAADALLAKYTLRAPCDGVVLSIQTAAGSYVSSQGAYGSYTQGFSPLIIMGTRQEFLEVRCYVDEILVTRLPRTEEIAAKMSIRGTDVTVPLTFERIQPYVSPKIELADQRQERVDVRVLPLIFRFAKPKNLNLYPGQLVDVYIGEREEK